MKVLVTGAAGFICGYLVAELLDAGHEVVGVDNFSKYGRVSRTFDSDPRYRLVEGDAKDARLLSELAVDCDHIVAGAAMIGGISYFHEFAYDLLAENERISAATFDAGVHAFRNGRLQKMLKGQDPLHILGDGSQVRHYTYGGDLARGIRLAIESERALNEDFNLSTARSTTVQELAEIVWRKVHGEDRPLRVVSDPPYEHDVPMRGPAVR